MNRYQNELDGLTVPETAKTALMERANAPARRKNWRPLIVLAAAAAALGVTAGAANLLGSWNIRENPPADRGLVMEQFGMDEEALTREDEDFLGPVAGRPSISAAFEVEAYSLPDNVRQEIKSGFAAHGNRFYDEAYGSLSAMEEALGVRVLRAESIDPALLGEPAGGTVWHEERDILAYLGTKYWDGRPETCEILMEWSTQFNGWGASIMAWLSTEKTAPEDGEKLTVYGQHFASAGEYFVESMGVDAKLYLKEMDGEGGEEYIAFFVKDNVAYSVSFFFPLQADKEACVCAALENMDYGTE